MMPLIGQYFCKVLEYKTSIYRFKGVLSLLHFAVLLPSLMRIDLLLLFLSLEFDIISIGVIVNRYLNVN
jgi:hypothetical protein